MSQVELTTLGESCEFFNGKAHEKDIDVDGKYIVVNSKFISQDGKVLKRTKEQMFPLFKGDIVMVMSDVPNGKALAKCAIIDEDDTYSLNQRICCIRSKEFDTKYLYYQLNRNEHFLAFNNGENQTNLRKADILACPLLKPSLEEQKRIIAELESTLFSLDKAKANAEKNLQNAKELFESYLQGVFENQGEGWEIKSWVDVVEIRSGRNQKEVEDANGKYPILGSAGKVMGYANKFICEEGTTIIGRKGTINSPMFIEKKFWNVDTAFGLHAKQNLDKRFLHYFCLSFNFLEMDRGSGRPSLVKSDLLQIEMGVPSLKIQKGIVQQLDTLREETQKLETLYQKKITALDELKKSILQKAFQWELESNKLMTVE